MRLDFSNLTQLTTFLLGAALGVVLCLFYDILRYFRRRKVFSAPITVFFCDIAFFLVASVVTTCFFILFSKGMIRVYVYFAEVLGFILCRLTLSRLFLAAVALIDRVLTTLLQLVILPISRTVSIIAGLLSRFFRRPRGVFFRKSRKKSKKIKKIFKKTLQ